MSALAHYLEDEGIATVCISLFRPHSECMTPPRSLWVPFELGRPLGEPNHPAFQSETLRAALDLLENSRQPGLITDFPLDAPSAVDDPDWVSPAHLDGEALPGNGDEQSLRAALLTEIEAVRPCYDAAITRLGRTTVGNSRMSVEAAAAYICGYAAGRRPISPVADMQPAVALRFAVDDLKTYYLEALASGQGRPSSRQLANWFWDRTVAARIICLTRSVCLKSEDRLTRAVANGQLVPGEQLRRLAGNR